MTSSAKQVRETQARIQSCTDSANDGLSDTGNPASQFRVEAGAPQLIKLAGFHQVFERYPNRLDNAVCRFGGDEPVDCDCDPIHGTLQCQVPKTDTIQASDGNCNSLIVKARVAEFETPELVVRYNVNSSTEHNVMMDTTLTDAPSNLRGDPQRSTHSLHHRFLNMLTREHRRKKSSPTYNLIHQCIAECLGTMFIVIFGVGSVCAAVLTGTSSGLWQIATVWGFGVALAILATVSVSGAHLNPAVSLAFALFRPYDFPPFKLLPYWGAQYLGGFLGGGFNLMLYGPLLRHLEALNPSIARGKPGSILTARAFGEYFPDPGLVDSDTLPLTADVISPAFAMMIEAWGTGILMFIILALTDPRQKVIRNKEMLPFYIGFTVSVLITLYAPLTQAGWNPARDFGPRLMAAIAGWGKVAIPGPRNGFWVYIVGPKIGAPIGALIYDLLINPGLTD